MPGKKEARRGWLLARAPGVCSAADDPEHTRRPVHLQLRVPVIMDGVFIGNEFVPIGPGLRASIRRMAKGGAR